MIIINGMVCWVGTSWAGWQEHQDHAGCKIINWSRADGHEHTECAIETAANGAGLADSGQQAAIGELASLRAARIQARALAVPLGGAAGSDGLTRLAVPEHALEPGSRSCNHPAVRLAQVIFPVAQQHPLRFVQRGPPGLLAPFGVASHLDVTPTRSTVNVNPRRAVSGRGCE